VTWRSCRSTQKHCRPGLGWRQLGRFVRPTDRCIRSQDVSVIGNPGARGKRSHPWSGQFASGHELRINSGVMEQGYRAGRIRWPVGVFSARLRRSRKLAAAYPIEPVLKLIANMGLPVDLVAAGASKKAFTLARVSGEPPELRTSVSSCRDGIAARGYDPDCDTPDALQADDDRWRPARLALGRNRPDPEYFVGPLERSWPNERQQLHYQTFGARQDSGREVKPAAHDFAEAWKAVQ